MLSLHEKKYVAIICKEDANYIHMYVILNDNVATVAKAAPQWGKYIKGDVSMLSIITNS